MFNLRCKNLIQNILFNILQTNNFCTFVLKTNTITEVYILEKE